MNIRRRIEKLEKDCPEPASGEFKPEFEFRVAGMLRADAIREFMRRLLAAIADPRATETQRQEWTTQLDKLGPVLVRELELKQSRPRLDELTAR